MKTDAAHYDGALRELSLGGAVSCSHSTSITRRAAVVAACCASYGAAAVAQQPTPAPQAPVLAPYRAPAIALVQPPAGGTVPQDKPVVVFRFAPGEPDDPIDVTSFVVTIDGEDGTTSMRVTATEAWGPLSASNSARGGVIKPGLHQLAARVCSVRGACGTTAVTVTVLPAAAADSRNAPASRLTPKQKLLDALRAAGRRLLSP